MVLEFTSSLSASLSGISSDTVLRPLSVLETNATNSPLEGKLGFDGFLSYPNIFPQPGHVKAEVMLYFVGPKNTVDQLIVLEATRAELNRVYQMYQRRMIG